MRCPHCNTEAIITKTFMVENENKQAEEHQLFECKNNRCSFFGKTVGERIIPQEEA